MTFKFLPDDLRLLNDRIEEICAKLREIGAEIRDCNERRDPVEDSFVRENVPAQEMMWAERFRTMKEIRDNAAVVAPIKGRARVGIGKRVTFRDESTGEEKRVKIGSFMVMTGEKDVVSYNAPVGRLLLGAKVGEIREGEICGRRKTLKVVHIS